MQAIKKFNKLNITAGSGRLDRIDPIVEEMTFDESIFDEKLSLVGKYGGNQSNINNNKNYLSDKVIDNIIDKYFSDSNLTAIEKQRLFQNMDINGCGYMAATNVIFDFTSDLSNQEFKNKFGFDRYNSNGDYNYDYMFLDYFLNYNKKKTNNIRAIYDRSEDKKLDLPEAGSGKEAVMQGSLVTESSDVIKDYLDDKGYNVIVKKSNNINDIESSLNSGKKVVVGLNNFTLTSIDDGKTKYLKSRHAIELTESLGDNRYKVSSWGKCYTIDLTGCNYENNKLDIGIYDK